MKKLRKRLILLPVLACLVSLTLVVGAYAKFTQFATFEVWKTFDWHEEDDWHIGYGYARVTGDWNGKVGLQIKYNRPVMKMTGYGMRDGSDELWTWKFNLRMWGQKVKGTVTLISPNGVVTTGTAIGFWYPDKTGVLWLGA